MLVDSHVHLFTRALPLASTAWTAPDVELPVETFEELMTRHGVTHGVISAMSLLEDRNDYTIAALRRNPRLRGTVDVDPGADRRVLARMRDDGVVGVRLQWRRRTPLPDLTDPDHRRLLRHVADLGWHVELNVERDRMPPVLDQLSRSGVDVVVDHYGDPCPDNGFANPGGEALLRALDTGRVRVKLSAGYRFPVVPGKLAGFAATLLAHAGPQRVFWGSDAPFVGAKRPVGYAGELAMLARIVPEPALRHQISAAAHDFYFSP
ncbi:amidohydrolase family protein [Actinophytocola glycyrrhizae]|uniref:Amidohydrolase family protein n=1 Tax=Actinophytocola glycyrrhizae TaxID=2044873 RepID=A0ABV9S4V3_9PSEU